MHGYKSINRFHSPLYYKIKIVQLINSKLINQNPRLTQIDPISEFNTEVLFHPLIAIMGGKLIRFQYLSAIITTRENSLLFLIRFLFCNRCILSTIEDNRCACAHKLIAIAYIKCTLYKVKMCLNQLFLLSMSLIE